MSAAQIRALKAEKAKHIEAAKALNEKPELSAEEQAQLDEHMNKAQALQARIEQAERLANLSAGLDDQGGVTVPANARIEVTENRAADATRGFASFGEFARAVAAAGVGMGRDQRLAAAPGTAANESSGADGGFQVPPQFSTELWRLSMLQGDSLLPLTQNTEVSGNSMLFPKDETTPWGGAGVQTYWQTEANAATASKPVLGQDTLVLHKLMTLVPVTNELLADGFAIGSYLNAVVPERIQWKCDEAILFGDGVGKPLGALSGPSVITQAKDSGQATMTVSAANVSNMVSRLPVGELKNAVWIANPDVLPLLEAMTLGNYPIFLPAQSAASGSYGMLKGRPLFLSEHASNVSTKGDLALVSLNGYRTITKAGGIQTETSMHLYFDADATAFRFIFRLNGKPILSAPIQPPKSSNTRSHFVQLAAR